MTPCAHRGWAAALCFAAAACGSVKLPEEHFYRLAYPDPEPQCEAPAAGGLVLRIERLGVATHLSGDRLMVGEGPVVVHPYRFHRWAGPVEGMVEDALVTALARSGDFARVKGAADGGDEDLVLTGRVLELQQQVEGERWSARVALELTLLDRARGTVLFHGELRRDEPVERHDPAAVVAGLSRGLAGIVDDVLARTRAAGAATDLAARPSR